MGTLTIKLGDRMKKDLEDMLEEMGINITSFFMIYAKKALRERKIPFEISAPPKKLDSDPFFSESNMKRLEESEQQFLEGKVIVKTMKELEAMAK